MRSSVELEAVICGPPKARIIFLFEHTKAISLGMGLRCGKPVYETVQKSPLKSGRERLGGSMKI
jgi:hypothetical protein